MVDEKLLQGIKNTLSRIDSLSKSDKLGELLLEFGVDITVLDEKEIISAIVKYLLDDVERSYYNQYQMYVKRQKMSEVGNVIDSLNALTTKVDSLYVERKEASIKISHIADIVKRIKMKMHDVPMVRIRCLYGHLEKDYDRYSSTTIKAGMDKSRMSDTIYNIEHGSFLLRQLKTKELARLKKELAAYKEKSDAIIDEKHERYVRTREEYTDLLRNVVMELLRDELFLNAALLSINSLFGEKFDVEVDSYGIEKVTREELKEVSKVMIIDKFFLYFDEHNNDKFDAQTFYNLLEEFMLYFYKNSIAKLEVKKNKCLSEINGAFLEQKQMMGNLVQYRSSISFDMVTSNDEEDTLSLVYAKQNK